MFAFPEVSTRGYHSAERKLYVWLQADEITFIHQITNVSEEIALMFYSNYNLNNGQFLPVQWYNFSPGLDFCWEWCSEVIAAQVRLFEQQFIQGLMILLAFM